MYNLLEVQGRQQNNAEGRAVLNVYCVSSLRYNMILCIWNEIRKNDAIKIFHHIFFLDEENGQEVIEKQCGEIERNEFDYNEGCETTKIPFKNKVCYCKTSLCNGASTFSSTFSFLKLAIALTSIYLLNYCRK